jgi:hypothetical protein
VRIPTLKHASFLHGERKPSAEPLLSFTCALCGGYEFGRYAKLHEASRDAEVARAEATLRQQQRQSPRKGTLRQLSRLFSVKARSQPPSQAPTVVVTSPLFFARGAAIGPLVSQAAVWATLPSRSGHACADATVACSRSVPDPPRSQLDTRKAANFRPAWRQMHARRPLAGPGPGGATPPPHVAEAGWEQVHDTYDTGGLVTDPPGEGMAVHHADGAPASMDPHGSAAHDPDGSGRDDWNSGDGGDGVACADGWDGQATAIPGLVCYDAAHATSWDSVPGLPSGEYGDTLGYAWDGAVQPEPTNHWGAGSDGYAWQQVDQGPDVCGSGGDGDGSGGCQWDLAAAGEGHGAGQWTWEGDQPAPAGTAVENEAPPSTGGWEGAWEGGWQAVEADAYAAAEYGVPSYGADFVEGAGTFAVDTTDAEYYSAPGPSDWDSAYEAPSSDCYGEGEEAWYAQESAAAVEPSAGEVAWGTADPSVPDGEWGQADPWSNDGHPVGDASGIHWELTGPSDSVVVAVDGGSPPVVVEDVGARPVSSRSGPRAGLRTLFAAWADDADGQ